MTDFVFNVKRAEDSPGLLLWQVTVTWQRLIKKALEPYNISHAQFVIMAITLWFESHSQNVSQGIIVNQSRLDKMTVSKALKKLAYEGYVKHIECQNDTRAKLVQLTKRGRALISKLVPLIERIDAEFFGVINNTDQKSLMSILQRLSVAT